MTHVTHPIMYAQIGCQKQFPKINSFCFYDQMISKILFHECTYNSHNNQDLHMISYYEKQQNLSETQTKIGDVCS